MEDHVVALRHQPPEVRHRIFGQRDADLPVGGIEVLMHRHVVLREWALRQAKDSYWRLYWPLSGGGEVIHNGHGTALRPGRLYLIPPHTSFDSKTRRTFSKWYIHFTLRGGSPVLAPMPGVYCITPSPRMRALLSETCPKIPRSGPTPRAPEVWRMIELVALVLSHAPAGLRPNTASRARLTAVLEHMDRAIAQKLTLAGLSNLAGLGTRALTNLFREHTGFPPIRYLAELRLNHCCRLLRHSTLTIEEIAEHCGFANRYYLTRMMRKYRQTTPAAFRRQARP
jgi:AraC-like DNA-binding protein